LLSSTTATGDLLEARTAIVRSHAGQVTESVPLTGTRREAFP
jgi:hypothetical protein